MYKRTSVVSLFIICFMEKLRFRKERKNKEDEYIRGKNTTRRK